MSPYLLPYDDPIVRCIERTGYPPWLQGGYEDDEDWEDDCDVYYGNETEDF